MLIRLYTYVCTIFLDDPDAQPADVRVKHLEIKIHDFLEQINSLDSGFSRQVGALTNRLTDMEKEVGEILEKLHMYVFYTLLCYIT